MAELKAIQKYLNSFGREVIKNAKSNLKSAGKGGGKLEKSLKFRVLPNPDGYTVEFTMADYGTFVDKGVKGKGGEIPNGKYKGKWGGRRHYQTWEGQRKDSPYKFGSGSGPKDGLRKGIASFIRKRGLQPRSEGGQYMSTKGLIYLISRNIYIRGIHGISFFQKPLGDAYKEFNLGFLGALKEDILTGLTQFKQS